MKNTLRYLVVLATVMALSVPALAQDDYEDEPEPAKLTFQGRVGAMYTGGEPFENGAAFEVGAMYRFAGPIHLHFFGGLTNFDKEGEIVPITDDFAASIAGFLQNNEIVDINRLNYKMNMFGGGLGIIQDLGAVELHLNAGAAAYELKFVADFDYLPLGLPSDLPPEAIDNLRSFISVQDEEWLYGFTAGGGLYYDFNQIISFGGHVNYHAIDTEAIDDLISFTIGMHIKIP